MNKIIDNDIYDKIIFISITRIRMKKLIDSLDYTQDRVSIAEAIISSSNHLVSITCKA